MWFVLLLGIKGLGWFGVFRVKISGKGVCLYRGLVRKFFKGFEFYFK